MPTGGIATTEAAPVSQARRRELFFALLRRAQADGSVAPDADRDVLVDMLAGGVTCRILQPNPPTVRQMKRYMESAYRQVGLLP